MKGLLLKEWYMMQKYCRYHLVCAIALPFSFRLGVEKGRTAYYVMVGFVCAASLVATEVFSGRGQAAIRPALPLAVLSFAGICVYGLSWYLSVVFYKKREL